MPSESRPGASWAARVLTRYHHFREYIRWRGKGGPKESRSSHADIMAMPRYHYDASLLFRRMILLEIDRAELAREEPLLLRELQGLCTLCGSKPECLWELQQGYDTGAPQSWRDYCPNAPTLNALGALQNCACAAPRFKNLTPRPDR